MSKMREINALTKNILLLALFISFCSLAICSKNISAFTSDNGWSWSYSKPVLYSSIDVGNINQGMCDGIYQSVQVYSLIGNRMVCVKNSGTIRFGFYYESGYYHAVVSYPLDNMFYGVNFGISNINDCLYIPSTDTLAMKENRINGYVKSLVLYKNISKRLSFTASSIGRFKYNLDLSKPDYIFQSSKGYAWPIGGFGASENGQWLAIELRERGIGILNIDTLEIKRISASILRYGQGYNPTTELAVSNSGQQVVQMGINSGLTFLDLSNNCGDIANDETMSQDYVRNLCRKVPIASLGFIKSFSTAVYPHFRNDGAELTFYAWSYDPYTKTKEVIIRAAGFMPQRVDYLAMGDSYSSGEGETDDKYYIDGTNTEFEKCHLSARSYPFLLASLSGIDPQFTKSVACSGAMTIDILGDDKNNYLGQGDRLHSGGSYMSKSEIALAQVYAKYNFTPGRIEQDNFVEYYKPKILTIGIGGNDINLVQKVKDCFLSIGTCPVAEDGPERAKYGLLIKNFYKRLVDTFQDLVSKSPNSKIYAIGYPGMIYVDGDCGTLGVTLDRTEREFMDESIRYLNQVIEAAAKNVGIGYVDRYNSLGAHVICGSGADGGNVIRLGDDVGYGFFKPIGNESFHPTPFGNELMADFIYNQIGNIDKYKYCSDRKNLCPISTTEPVLPNYWGAEKYIDLPRLVYENYLDKTEFKSYDKTLEVNVGSGNFQPNSSVDIVISSNPTVLGSFIANSNGGLSTFVILPEDFESGYHTVHLNGKSFSGEDIEICQSITILADSNELSLGVASDKKGAASNMIDADVLMVDSLLNPSSINLNISDNNTKTIVDNIDDIKNVNKSEPGSISKVKGAETTKSQSNNLEKFDNSSQLYIIGFIIFVPILVLIVLSKII